MFDTNKAGVRASNLWLRVGGLLAAAAIAQAKKAEAYPLTSSEAALVLTRAADYCFWQATGEGDCSSAETVFGKREQS